MPLDMKSEITAISPSLRIRRSRRARRLCLRLDSKERVVDLVIPLRTSLRKAYDFAKEHQDWIDNSLNRLPDRIDYSDGNLVPIAGKTYLIRHVQTDEMKPDSVRLQGTGMIANYSKKSPQKLIDKFIINYAANKITESVEEKTEIIGVNYSKLSVRDTKTRWGSCSDTKSLSFSWRLIFAPPAVMDYVIAHEVAHLVYMNHGKNFWLLCKNLSQDFDYGKEWIQEQGHELMRYRMSA